MKKIEKEFIIKNTKWIILFICLIGFLSLAEDVFNKEIMTGDIIGYKMVSTFLISDFATPIAKFIAKMVLQNLVVFSQKSALFCMLNESAGFFAAFLQSR